MRRFRPHPLLLGLTLALAVPPTLPALVPIVETRADETRPRLAYDETHDRFLAVWETGGGVSARLLDAGGAPIGDPIPLDESVLDPPGQNQGFERFGKVEFS